MRGGERTKSHFLGPIGTHRWDSDDENRLPEEENLRDNCEMKNWSCTGGHSRNQPSDRTDNSSQKRLRRYERDINEKYPLIHSVQWFCSWTNGSRGVTLPHRRNAEKWDTFPIGWSPILRSTRNSRIWRNSLPLSSIRRHDLWQLLLKWRPPLG